MKKCQKIFSFLLTMGLSIMISGCSSWEPTKAVVKIPGVLDLHIDKKDEH